MHKYIDVAALGKVLLASLIAGVGLVSFFGLGLVALSEHAGRMEGAERRGGPVWLFLAGLCFLVVLVGVGLGISSIVNK